MELVYKGYINSPSLLYFTTNLSKINLEKLLCTIHNRTEWTRIVHGVQNPSDITISSTKPRVCLEDNGGKGHAPLMATNNG